MFWRTEPDIPSLKNNIFLRTSSVWLVITYSAETEQKRIFTEHVPSLKKQRGGMILLLREWLALVKFDF